MDRTALLAASLVLSLVSLFLLVYFYRCPEYDPDGMRNGVGDCVTVRGYVARSRFTGRTCIYRVLLPSGAYVKVVEFGSQGCKNGYLCAEGRVQLWRGEREVVVLRYC